MELGGSLQGRRLCTVFTNRQTGTDGEAGKVWGKSAV